MACCLMIYSNKVKELRQVQRYRVVDRHLETIFDMFEPLGQC